MLKIKIKLELMKSGDLVDYNGDLFLILAYNGTDHFQQFLVLDLQNNLVKKKNFTVFRHKLFVLLDS